MTQLPRSVTLTQSPVPPDAGVHGEVALLVLAAVGVPPQEDGHGGHRRRDDELAHAPGAWVSGLVIRLESNA